MELQTINEASLMGSVTVGGVDLEWHRVEVFDHTAFGGVRLDINRLKQFVAAHAEEEAMQPVRVVIDKEHVRRLTLNGTIEPRTVLRMTPERRDTPIILLRNDADEHTIVDGNHRFVRRFLDGFADALAIILPEEPVLRAFVFVPPERMIQVGGPKW